MSWTVARGLENGDTVIVTIDNDFRALARRGGRDTRVSVRFLGPHMLKTVENRNTFEERFIPLLDAYGGVLVAGITRTQPVSYTFLGYCSDNIDPSAIPIDESLRTTCSVSVSHDPEWKEYEKWLPPPAKGLARIAMFLRSLPLRFVRRD